jgi:hypothetical protein
MSEVTARYKALFIFSIKTAMRNPFLTPASSWLKK